MFIISEMSPTHLTKNCFLWGWKAKVSQVRGLGDKMCSILWFQVFIIHPAANAPFLKSSVTNFPWDVLLMTKGHPLNNSQRPCALTDLWSLGWPSQSRELPTQRRAILWFQVSHGLHAPLEPSRKLRAFSVWSLTETTQKTTLIH